MNEKNSASKESIFDIVLFGATGFTGRLVAGYLLKKVFDNGLRVALAGRNKEKLERLRSDLARSDERASEWPIEIVDARDGAALLALAKRSRVMCTTVGPYALYGMALVKACAEAGTHYCDLTGEVQFMRSTIDSYDAQAQKSGARIVHCCGFDSIPSDLGTLMVQDYAEEHFGGPCASVHMQVGPMKGGFSGGTLASGQVMLEALKKDASLRSLLNNPYSLNPDPTHQGADGKDRNAAYFDEATQTWAAPFFMAPVNTRVVRRSNALLGERYGKEFKYLEYLGLGAKAGARFKAWAVAAVSGVSVGLLLLGPSRMMLQRFVLPKPGEGPDQHARDEGFFVMTARGLRPGGDNSVQVVGRIAGDSDPGYGETAKMLGESAMCLALEEDELPSSGGVLTPASAMGQVLIERLKKAGMCFEVSHRECPSRF